MSDFQFGYDLTQPNLRIDMYQDDFLNVNKTIIGMIADTSEYTFTFFRMFRNSSNCNLASSYSYFDLSSQRCCKPCPSQTQVFSTDNICQTCNISQNLFLGSDSTCKNCSTQFVGC